MTQQEFSKISSDIPTQPGIYKYYDANNQLLYVGKAKHLRKRVSSYFSKTFTSYKTHELVNRIHHIEFTIVDTEQEAFLLENTLIKEYQPKFNINLKDDKSYPYIVIKKEPFPRVFFTRRKINDGSKYFGPYTSVSKVKELLDFIKENILLRTCKLNLTESNITKGKFKVCLQYHLGNCKGPCEGLQTLDDYNEELEQLANLLKGNLSGVIQHFKKEMKLRAEQMQFEKAVIYKKKIEHLQQYQSTSTVVNSSLGRVDAFSILEEGNIAYVNYLAVNNGAIVLTKTIVLEKKLEETPAEILCFAVAQLRTTFNSDATEIIVPIDIDFLQKDIKISVPKGGDRKKLLALSEKNVNYFKEDLKKKKMLHLEQKTDAEKMDVLQQLQQHLQLQHLPTHIECFDNSNMQGSFPVSAMVCFKNGQPSKENYRRFKVKTVKGINDFATMSEVVLRRYKRLLEEKQPLPQLIVIDGGKGQLSAALESIDLLAAQYGNANENPFQNTTLVGLAKNEEEIFFKGDTQSFKLPWDSESLKLLRRIRDEVHRFGITFHRNLRSQGAFTNELEGIQGIGNTTSNQLLKAFKSVKNIKQKSLQELEAVVGLSKAKILQTHFNNQEL
jgi:excinuclease ABC subunit C